MPDEDQGYLIGLVSLPLGASMQRTEAVATAFAKQMREQPEVERRVCHHRPEPAHRHQLLVRGHRVHDPEALGAARPGRRTAPAALAGRANRIGAGIKEATVLTLNPPPIPGIGTAGGFEFIARRPRRRRHRASLPACIGDFVGQANHQPALTRVFTQFSTQTPQIEYVLDRERAKTLGVTISSIFSALQTFLGGTYINDFNMFGRTYKVTAQADAGARNLPDSVDGLYVRTAQNDMVPLSTLVTIKPKTGPEYIERYNVFRAVTINGSPASGYSSGQATQAMEQLAPEPARWLWLRLDRHHLPGKALRRTERRHLRHGDRVRIPGAGGAV